MTSDIFCLCLSTSPCQLVRTRGRLRYQSTHGTIASGRERAVYSFTRRSNFSEIKSCCLTLLILSNKWYKKARFCLDSRVEQEHVIGMNSDILSRILSQSVWAKFPFLFCLVSANWHQEKCIELVRLEVVDYNTVLAWPEQMKMENRDAFVTTRSFW